MGAKSNRQQEVLEFIRATVATRGYPPSVREIGLALGLSSPSTVHSHLSGLVKAGLIRRDATKPRAIELLDRSHRSEWEGRVRSVPLVGRIAAGSPLLAEEDLEDVVPLPTDFVGTGPVFMLRVRGDSMIGAGILDGDYVVVRRQADAEDGEIVAALIKGEEATVKRLQRTSQGVVLIAENPEFPPMQFSDGVEILGKVVSVLRRVR